MRQDTTATLIGIAESNARYAADNLASILRTMAERHSTQVLTENEKGILQITVENLEYVLRHAKDALAR